MQFTELNLAPDIWAGLGLPDFLYEVPSVYFEHVGRDPIAPPIEAMLFALQKRA